MFSQFKALIATFFGLTANTSVDELTITANGKTAKLSDFLGSAEGVEAILADTTAATDDRFAKMEAAMNARLSELAQAVSTENTALKTALQQATANISTLQSELTAAQKNTAELAGYLSKKAVDAPILNLNSNGKEPFAQPAPAANATLPLSTAAQSKLLDNFQKKYEDYLQRTNAK